jgi:hypothetical protein
MQSNDDGSSRGVLFITVGSHVLLWLLFMQSNDDGSSRGVLFITVGSHVLLQSSQHTPMEASLSGILQVCKCASLSGIL